MELGKQKKRHTAKDVKEICRLEVWTSGQ